MIHHKNVYLDFLSRQGVGSKDVVASSPASYVSYLNSVAKLTGMDVSPATLRTERDVQSIARRISGKRANNTIRNYCSAMRQYISMVEAEGL
ncbi:MAG: hypothetical protein J0L57_13585 [Burkholderiales bacterium]|nr:hypothetical protein [Burkholderiales bacterium]